MAEALTEAVGGWPEERVALIAAPLLGAGSSLSSMEGRVSEISVPLIRSSDPHAVVVIPRFSELPEKHLRRVATIPSALAAVSGAHIYAGMTGRTRLLIVNRCHCS